MSSMSMFMHGIGNEAFEPDAPAVPLALTVDDAELVATEAGLNDSLAAMTAEGDRLVALQEVRTYGESIRETLSESAAAELQRRVVEVLGVERGATLVGSVENYNGSLGGSLLDAGLESIDGLIKNAIAELVRLMRMAFKMFTQYFTSAQVVLSKQLTINQELRARLANSDATWSEWHEDVRDTSRGIKVGPYQLSGQQLQMLCTVTNAGLQMPSNFLAELSATITALHNTAAAIVNGLLHHYNAILDLVQDSPRLVDAQRLTRLRETTLDRYIPLNKMLVNDNAHTGMTMIATRPMLGGKIFATEAPSVSVYSRYGNFTHQISAAECFKKIAAGIYSVKNSSSRSSTTVQGLSRTDGINALNMIDGLVAIVMGLGYSDDVAMLAKRADALANRVLPTLNTERGVNYIEHMTEIMSVLTRVTTQAPRDYIGYVAALTDAVRAYVAASAGVSA